MYTTLNILKSGDACVPGFTRMASFFGTNAAIKNQRIPLHVVSLVGGKDDAIWALNNAAVIDEDDYKKFYHRHLPAVFKRLLYNSIERRKRRDQTKNPLLNKLILAAFACHTFEQVETFLKKARQYRFDHDLYHSVIEDKCWASPHLFIAECINSMAETYSHAEQVAFPEDLFVPADGKNPFDRARPKSKAINLDTDEGDEEGEGDDSWTEVSDTEEEEAPPRSRTRAAPRSARAVAADRSSTAARSARAARALQVDDDCWEDFVRPNVQLKYRTEFATWRNQYPHFSSSSQEVWFFRSMRRNRSSSQNLAYLLCNEGDPYDFMGLLNYKLPKGISVTRAENNQPARMSCDVNDTKQMFALMRMLSARGELPDVSADD